jgi:hypothetical protein
MALAVFSVLNGLHKYKTWCWYLIAAGLHDTQVLFLELHSGDRDPGCVGAILKHYPSGTIRISLPLDGGWGKHNKITTVFWSVQAWRPPQ